MRKAGSDTAISWSRVEVKAAVDDYFHMLTKELSGQKYKKAAHRRELMHRLTDRSEASVELKHQNISAVLIDLGAPWIVGYKPMRNYQKLLYDVVVGRLRQDGVVDRAASAAVEQPAVAPLNPDFSGLLVPAPAVTGPRDQDVKPTDWRTQGTKRNYLELEARNRSLGKAGEEYIVAYEIHRLRATGARRLADRVEHVSVTQGDGLGYDVLSFDSTGKERLIEVKTTAFGREAPFFVTRTELKRSQAEPERFHLYRLFDFRRKPRMFDLVGAVNARCLLDPVSYVAKFL